MHVRIPREGLQLVHVAVLRRALCGARQAIWLWQKAVDRLLLSRRHSRLTLCKKRQTQLEPAPPRTVQQWGFFETQKITFLLLPILRFG